MQRANSRYAVSNHCLYRIRRGSGIVPPIPLLNQIGSCSHTKVRFGLSSSPVFSRTDLITDSESFYASVITLLEDPEEQDEVRQLLAWWDRYEEIVVFYRQSNSTTTGRYSLAKSALAQSTKILSSLRSKSAGKG
jgi:hypothetical protein